MNNIYRTKFDLKVETIEIDPTCAAARSAFIELIGSLGSSAEAGIPAACAAAINAALFAAAAADVAVDEDGLDRDL